MNAAQMGHAPMNPPARTPLNGARTADATPRTRPSVGWMVVVCLGIAFLWSYRLTFQQLLDVWSHNPLYSHGFLVPLFAAFLLWTRRDLYEASVWKPSLLGLPLILLGLILRWVGSQMFLDALEYASLLPMLAGVVLFVGGVSIFLWCWPAVLFLGFMMPLPFQAEELLAQQLRHIATVWSTYALQTIGYSAIYEGNIILVDDHRLGVADACSGLGMLMTFFALATAAAFLATEPWQRAVLLLSAVPIAVIVNVIRITATGMAFASFGKEVGQAILHDFAGWLMMPMALLFLWLEMMYLNRLVYESSKPAPVFMPRS